MSQVFNSCSPKKVIKVSINSDLLEKAKALDINLAAALEDALIVRVRAEQQSQWKSKNAKAILAYNHFVKENGVFSDGLRKF